MKNTLKVGGFLFLGVVLFATLSSVKQNSTETAQIAYVQNPPIAKQYWVQKIKSEGEYAVLLKVRFEHDVQLPESLSVYKNGEIAHILVDDGSYPDDKANDGVFATIVNEDPTVFANQVIQRQNNIKTKGYTLRFTGHSGELIHYDKIRKFNIRDFDHFELQELDANLIEGATTCDMDENAILKQNSLLITEKKVVEDPVRTYNVVSGQGASQGAWTFGELMKNMAGGYADEANPTLAELEQVRAFLKQWIIQLYSQFSVNGIISPSISANKVLKMIALQWIRIAKDDVNFNVPVIGDTESWQTIWDTEFTSASDIQDLLAAAPFKLSAIVNRVDLRGNSGYGGGNGSTVNAGETRFIFSLIHGVHTFLSLGNNIGNLGNPPIFYPTANATEASGSFEDWNGMNVILEYSNVAFSECGIKALGQKWKDLSNYDLEDDQELSIYLTKLQEITDLVTTRNANVEKTNGSAISQVRTNAKIFGHNHMSARWNLREFRLDDNTGYLVNAPTKNMPFASNNTRRNSKFEANVNSNLSSQHIVDWTYDFNARRVSVIAGNHNLPNNQLNPTSVMVDEMQSYYALGFWNDNFPDNFYDDDNYNQSASPNDKAIRHQLSLNSCMGCHGAETKTLFTMIRPLGYGQEADYWSEIPSTTTGHIKNNPTSIDNAGTTYDPNHPDANGFIDNYDLSYYQGSTSYEDRTVPNVSPFLTGRNYRGTSLGFNERWDDDQEDDNDQDESNLDLGDDRILGLFYVNDPSNEGDVNHEFYYSPNSNIVDSPFPKVHDKKYGYNELENRRMDLCLLTTENCSSGVGGAVFTLVSTIGFVPLPEHGH